MTKEELLTCIARLQFTGNNNSYQLILRPGLGIAVNFEDSGYAVIPLIDVPKLSGRPGVSLEGIVKGPADTFSLKKHTYSSDDFELEKFLQVVEKTRDFLKKLNEFYKQ